MEGGGRNLLRFGLVPSIDQDDRIDDFTADEASPDAIVCPASFIANAIRNHHSMTTFTRHRISSSVNVN
jgi:hypothetical protein